MEQIIRERTYRQLESCPPRLRPSPLLLIVFILLIGFAAVTMAVRLVAQYSIAPANPFPAYADVFPGQPVSAVKARPFSCWSDYKYYHNPTEGDDPTAESCIFTPASGIFSSVQVIISEGIIRQSIFLMRDSTLQVGDLALFLEMPAIRDFYHVVYFASSKGFVSVKTIDPAKRFSFFLPVWSISFTDMRLVT